MKLIACCFTLLMIGTFQAFGQSDSIPATKNSKFHIYVKGGAVMPVGELSQFEQIEDKRNFDNYSIAGEAMPGWGAELGSHILIGKHFGIAEAIYLGSFSSAKHTTDEIYEEENLTYYPGDGEVVEAGKWEVVGFLVGIVYEAEKNKFRYGGKLLGGFQKTTSPETKLIAITPPAPPYPATQNTFVQEPMRSTAFAYRAGAYGAFKLSKMFWINLSADYTAASASFAGDFNTENIYLTNPIPQPWTYTARFNKNISFVNIMLGVEIDL